VPDPKLVPVEDRPTLLVVAGLDPSGGAGLTLDVAVARAFGVHPLGVLTAVAVENTRRLSRRVDLEGEDVRGQLAILGEEFLIGSVKAGMLATEDAVRALAEWLADRPRLPLVLDPVLRASSGGALGEPGLLAALRAELLPRTRVVTPNLDELAALTGREAPDRGRVPEAARALREQGATWVLVTGGHLARDRGADFLCGPDTETWLEESSRTVGNVRGTGCALATAVAAGLARGETVPDAVREAKAFVTAGLDRSYVTGEGRFLGWGDRS
jgi:hydroxymethylpyrimidine/phosphomethylpyrimidine kinase